jgi:hypothetical protein
MLRGQRFLYATNKYTSPAGNTFLVLGVQLCPTITDRHKKHV